MQSIISKKSRSDVRKEVLTTLLSSKGKPITLAIRSMSHVAVEEACKVLQREQERLQPQKLTKEVARALAVTHLAAVQPPHTRTLTEMREDRATTTTTKIREQVRSSKNLVAITKRTDNKPIKMLYHLNS